MIYRDRARAAGRRHDVRLSARLRRRRAARIPAGSRLAAPRGWINWDRRSHDLSGPGASRRPSPRR